MNVVHTLGADDWVMLLAGACSAPYLQYFCELMHMSGATHRQSSMYHKGLPLGTWET